MQTIRGALKTVLPLGGMLVAFAGVVYLQNDFARLVAVLAGILLVEAGIWNLANPILPSSRRYIELRAVVVEFIARVPSLNSAAVDARSSGSASNWEGYQVILSEMHALVDRMGELAGKEKGMSDTQPPPP